MLMPIQSGGEKPPLFFIHGSGGIAFLVGPTFARALGPHQPVYIIQANGMDGRQPVIDDVRAMVLAYIEQIERARPTGPLRIGAMCAGCFVATEIASTLKEKGRQTGPVILVDPPIVPPGYDKRQQTSDARQPEIAERLYQELRARFLDRASNADEALPFDLDDPEQLHAAILAGIASITAFARFVPKPFPGTAEVILSAERASGFFHPMMPWQKLLPGPRVVHVLPWPHLELFSAGRKSVARLMRSMLDEPPASEFAPELPNKETGVPAQQAPRDLPPLAAWF